MEKAKRKNDTPDLRRYWRFFLPLTIVLGLMVRFPVRIVLGESFWDTVFYGTIVLICIGTAIHVYRRFGRHSHRFVAVALLCSVLAGWQIVDMTLLRYERAQVYPYAFEPIGDGGAYYKLRVSRDRGGCGGYLTEQFIGNSFIAIVYHTDRNAMRMGCGG